MNERCLRGSTTDQRRSGHYEPMTRTLTGCALGSLLALLVGCSSEEPGNSGGQLGMAGTQTGSSGATTAGSNAGPTAGSNPGTSGSSMGGSGSAGESTGGVSMGGASGGAGGGAAGGGTLPEGPFACTVYLGLLTTNEWYSKGFEDGVDGTKWELRYHHYGYVRTWADGTSPFWGDTGDSFGLDSGSPIQSPCATNPMQPDRMVFAALDWEMATKDEWLAALEMAIGTFKAKYPSLKRIDVMTLIRCPGNTMCNPNADYGP